MMNNMEWPAQDYAIGSYIQATIADRILPALHLEPTDSVLDIGCGNGGYTRKIIAKVPQGSVLGIDASENMVQLARQISEDFPNFDVEQGNVLNMTYSNQFDKVVTFWCLQWTTDIQQAFDNIFKALKPGGKVFAVIPLGNDPYISGYYALKESNQFPSLKNFKPPMDYSNLDNLAAKLSSIVSKNLKIEIHKASIILPSLDIYRKFVNGIGFYQSQLPDSEVMLINDAMVRWYEHECQQKWQGQLQFNCSTYLVTGQK